MESILASALCCVGGPCVYCGHLGAVCPGRWAVLEYGACVFHILFGKLRKLGTKIDVLLSEMTRKHPVFSPGSN